MVFQQLPSTTMTDAFKLALDNKLYDETDYKKVRKLVDSSARSAVSQQPIQQRQETPIELQHSFQHLLRSH